MLVTADERAPPRRLIPSSLASAHRTAYRGRMSRARQRQENDRLVAILAGAPWRDWTARLQVLGDEGRALARSLLRAYRHGALTIERWTQLAGRAPRDLAEIDDTIRQLWDALSAAKLVDQTSIGEWNAALTRGLIHRWAWQPRWYLVEQDEDLVLMDHSWIPILLEVAADRRVPKRDYLIQIVAHHTRDWACHAFYNAEDVAGTLPRLAAWAPQARAAGATALADYLDRVGTYAAERRVDRDAAVQFFLDLGRCSEPPRSKLDVRPVPGGYEGLIIHSAGDRRFRIAAATGEVTRVTTGDPRR